MAKHIMTLTVNGDKHELMVSDTDTLLDVIRNSPYPNRPIIGLWFRLMPNSPSCPLTLTSIPDRGAIFYTIQATRNRV